MLQRAYTAPGQRTSSVLGVLGRSRATVLQRRVSGPIAAERKAARKGATSAKATDGNSYQFTAHAREANYAETAARLAMGSMYFFSMEEEELMANSLAALKDILSCPSADVHPSGRVLSTEIGTLPDPSCLECFVEARLAAREQAQAADQEASLQCQLAEQGEQIASLQWQLAEHEEQIADLQQHFAEHEDAVADVGTGFEEGLAELERQVRWLEEYNSEQRDGVLGGLLADIVDQVVTAAVLGPGNVNYLSELKEAIEGGEEDSTACARWQTVVQYLEQRSGVSVDVLIANMRPLWECPVQYGSEAEISTADLQLWASSQPPKVKVAVDQLLLILEPLTHPGRPLCLLDQATINKAFRLEA